MENIITMIAELDPNTIDHVMELIKEGNTSGELSICLQVLDVCFCTSLWWAWKEFATKVEVLEVSDLATLKLTSSGGGYLTFQVDDIDLLTRLYLIERNK